MTPVNTRSSSDDSTAVAVHRWLADHHGQLLDDLAACVERETPSDNKALLDEGLTHVLEWLDERCGGGTLARGHFDGVHGDTAVVDLPGQLPGPPVLVLAHYDTVWPEGTLAQWPFTVTGGRASGPGVYDMKAGLVQGVWALRALDALGLPRPPVRLLLSGDEEIGSPLSREVIEREAAGCRACLVLEPSAGDGDLKVARKGIADFDITAHGIEAHAGLEPHHGASAVTAIAEATLAANRLADPWRGTTVNVGVLNGGSRPNVIAGHATAQIDVRVAEEAEGDRVERALRALVARDPRIRLTVTGGWNRPVFADNPATQKLFLSARRIAAALGVHLSEAHVGGASDGNFVAPLGVPVLDGLGAVGDGAHARHEYVDVDTLTERAALFAGLLSNQTANPSHY